jgi:predicted Holliday junction resolvase-like endonuclease
MSLALAEDYEHFWWLSIGLGVVVLLVVVVLLSLLVSLVKDIRGNAVELSSTARAMLANTDSRQLDEAADAAGRLRAEAELLAGDGE